MDIYEKYHNTILEAISSLQADGLIKNNLSLEKIVTQPPKDPNNGDIASNAALVLSKQVGLKPMVLAELIVNNLKSLALTSSVKVAEPGFINISLNNSYWLDLIQTTSNGTIALSNIGQNKKVLIEFVSVNPTGPLHIGHTRGAVYGDALANLLSAVGYKVEKEYYINDAGNQINLLERSIDAAKQNKPIPEDGYQGDYIYDLATSDKDAVQAIMDMIKADLADLGVTFDRFISEKKVIELETQKGTTLGILGIEDLTYKDGDALVFKSTLFGDDKDRVLIKSNGELTYFVGDLYYHHNKVDRGYDKLINVWGSDHSGYVKRLVSATKIFNPKVDINVELMQLVHFMRDGKPMKMSKRQASYITLREVLDEVGKDALRFLLLNQTNGKDIQFDLDKAVEKSMDNPLWYVQYAHTRICSLTRQIEKHKNILDALEKPVNQISLINAKELELLKKLNQWPYIVGLAAKKHEPHQVVAYLYELAGIFHSIWADSNNRFILPQDLDTSCFRLKLAFATREIIACGFGIIGVEPLEEM